MTSFVDPYSINNFVGCCGACTFYFAYQKVNEDRLKATIKQAKARGFGVAFAVIIGNQYSHKLLLDNGFTHISDAGGRTGSKLRSYSIVLKPHTPRKRKIKIAEQPRVFAS